MGCLVGTSLTKGEAEVLAQEVMVYKSGGCTAHLCGNDDAGDVDARDDDARPQDVLIAEEVHRDARGDAVLQAVDGALVHDDGEHQRDDANPRPHARGLPVVQRVVRRRVRGTGRGIRGVVGAEGGRGCQGRRRPRGWVVRTRRGEVVGVLAAKDLWEPHMGSVSHWGMKPTSEPAGR